MDGDPTTQQTTRNLEPLTFESHTDTPAAENGPFNLTFGDDDDPDDGGGFGDWDAEVASQDVIDPSLDASSQYSSQLANSLVDAPELVQNIKISYARRAKRVDIEKLKNSIWNELCVEGPSDDPENRPANAPRVILDDVPLKPRAFSDMLTTLPQSVDRKSVV